MASLHFEQPLNLTGPDLIEPLEGLALYPYFSEELDKSVDLFNQAKDCLDALACSPPDRARAVVSAMVGIRGLAYNIQQSYNTYGGDIAPHIRSSRLQLDEGITDAHCLAALAVDRACWSVQVLGNWLIEFDEQRPSGVDVASFRSDRAEDERDARISADVYRQMAQQCLTEAERSARLAEEETHKQTIARAKSQKGREVGIKSGEIRRENVEARDKSICEHGATLLKAGHAERDIVGMIHRSAKGKRWPNDPSNDLKLSTKQLRSILRKGGVLN